MDEYQELWAAGSLPAAEVICFPIPSTHPTDLALEPGLGPLAKHFIEQFTQEELAAMRAWAEASPQTFATACSGTDIAVHCHAALADAMATAAGAKLQMQQTFACESNKDKQGFLKAVHPCLGALFADTAELSSEFAVDMLSDSLVLVKANSGLVAGFPCQDASLLNAKARSSGSRRCVSQRTKRTGKVFNDLMAYMTMHQSELQWIVLENVWALSLPPKSKTTSAATGPSNLDVVVHRLQSELPMTVVTLNLDPRLFGQVSSRSRLYIVGIRNCILRDAGLSREDFAGMAEQTVMRLMTKASVPLDKVLLEETSPIVQDHISTLEQHAAKKQKPSQPSGEWGVKHSKAFEAAGSDWWEPSAFRLEESKVRFGGLRELSGRQIDLLEKHKVCLPEPQPCTIDLNPSVVYSHSISHNTVTCLSSTSTVYLAHRGRCAVGVECLRFLGFFAELEVLARFPGHLLKDLAGNMFDGASYMATATTIVHILAQCARLKRSGSGRRFLSAMWSGSGEASDSD